MVGTRYAHDEEAPSLPAALLTMGRPEQPPAYRRWRAGLEIRIGEESRNSCAV